ncbi:MAG: FtsX-like permease family protein [Thermomicrobiales bacterium]|nr:FtsX-like permease family protein [Thermomicrobiales bacterium]
MISLMLQQLRTNWKRTTAVFLAVLLGVAFVTASLFVGNLYNNSLRDATGDQVLGADLVVTSENGDIDASVISTIAEQPGVVSVDNRLLTSGGLSVGSTSSYLSIGPIPQIEAVRANIPLKEGVWPTAPDEIAISQAQADAGGLTVGETISWTSWESDQTHTFTIVGISPNDTGIGMSVMGAFVTPDSFVQIAPDARSIGLLVDLDDTVSPGSVAASMESVAGSSVQVRTFDDYVDDAVEYYAGGAVAIQVIVLGFAVIAMIAAGIVIANSFEISYAQRTRELGLLRSVGATARQVRRMVLMESAVIGLISAVAGALCGVAIVASLNRLLFDSGRLVFDPVRFIVPVMLGLVVTMIAALAPSRTAMRVQPLQAIRQTEAPLVDHRASRLRKLASIALIALGLAVMGGGIVLAFTVSVDSGMPMLVGILGGAVSFLGVLISTQVVVPAIARFMARIVGNRSSATGELAFSNLNRNPRRTASTSTALLMGVTLITMMAVGVTMIKSTLINVVNTENPIDLEIEGRDDNGSLTSLSASELRRWQEIDGVHAFVVTYGGSVATTDDYPVDLVGVDLTNAQKVLRTNVLAEASDDTLVINQDLGRSLGVTDGDTITLIANGNQVTLRVIVERGIGDHAVVSQSVLETLTPDAPMMGVWIRLEDSASTGDVLKEVRKTELPGITLSISGSAAFRAEMLDILDTIFLIALGLLTASIVIAIVGIGNTLTLSVIERTRETGMLRAMGLKRGQVRTMLATEGVLLALIGCGVGLILGTLYGIAGVYCVFGDSFAVVFSLPWLWLLEIVIVAVLSGVIASIIPARRSLRIEPVEALASVS